MRRSFHAREFQRAVNPFQIRAYRQRRALQVASTERIFISRETVKRCANNPSAACFLLRWRTLRHFPRANNKDLWPFFYKKILQKSLRQAAFFLVISSY